MAAPKSPRLTRKNQQSGYSRGASHDERGSQVVKRQPRDREQHHESDERSPPVQSTTLHLTHTVNGSSGAASEADRPHSLLKIHTYWANNHRATNYCPAGGAYGANASGGDRKGS